MAYEYPAFALPYLTTAEISPSSFFALIPDNKKITILILENLKRTSFYLQRPFIEVAKVVNAIARGSFYGVKKARDVVCDIGAPTATFSSLTAIGIQSGKPNAPAFNIFKYFFQNPLTGLFQGSPSLPMLTEGLEATNRYFLNASPEEFFFSGLLQGALLHEAFSTNKLAAKEGQIAAEQVENKAVEIGIIETQEKHSTYYAETAAVVSAKISTVASIVLLVEVLRYGFDSDTYSNHTFSEHVNNSIRDPIQRTYNLGHSYFNSGITA